MFSFNKSLMSALGLIIAGTSYNALAVPYAHLRSCDDVHHCEDPHVYLALDSISEGRGVSADGIAPGAQSALVGSSTLNRDSKEEDILQFVREARALELKNDDKRLYWDNANADVEDFLKACNSDVFEEIEIWGKKGYLSGSLGRLANMPLSNLRTLFLDVFYSSIDNMDEQEADLRDIFRTCPGLEIVCLDDGEALRSFRIATLVKPDRVSDSTSLSRYSQKDLYPADNNNTRD